MFRWINANGETWKLFNFIPVGNTDKLAISAL